jgi:hypothetical protein
MTARPFSIVRHLALSASTIGGLVFLALPFLSPERTAADAADLPAPKFGVVTIMGRLFESARIDSEVKNDLPELRFLYEQAVALNRKMEALTQGAKQQTSYRLSPEIIQTAAFDEDTVALGRLLKSAQGRNLTDEEVASLCALSSGGKDAYVANLLLHSYACWNRTPILPAEEILDLIPEPRHRGIRECQLLRLLVTVPNDFRLAGFKSTGKSEFSALWEVGNFNLPALFAKGFNFKELGRINAFATGKTGVIADDTYVGWSVLWAVGKRIWHMNDIDIESLPMPDRRFVRFLVLCGYARGPDKVLDMYNDKDKLQSCFEAGMKTAASMETFAGLDITSSDSRLTELAQHLRSEPRYWLAMYLGRYGSYRVAGPSAGLVLCADDPSSLTDDAEIDYINRLEKAVRRLAKLRRKSTQSCGALKSYAEELRREQRISGNQYQTILKYIDSSEEISRILDKLNRIFIIDKPLQLWADLTARRVSQALGIIRNNRPQIMAAGTSLSRVSFLLPHTVESKTSTVVVGVTSAIKQKLSSPEFEQTQLESKIQPDWFKQTGLEIIKGDGK